VFPGTKFTAETLDVDVVRRRASVRPAAVQELIGKRKAQRAGVDPDRHGGACCTRRMGEGMPVLAAVREVRRFQDAEAGQRENTTCNSSRRCRGNGKTSAPFDYFGSADRKWCCSAVWPRASRKRPLCWDAAEMKVDERRRGQTPSCARKLSQGGWEVEGL